MLLQGDLRGFVALALCAALIGCGDVSEKPSDPSCPPWKPQGAAWTSLPTSRPASLQSPAASSDDKYLYAIGSWIENGAIKNGLLRSSDLGTSWCALPAMPESPSEVVPSKGDVLYATSVPDAQTGAVSAMKSSDGGHAWKIPPAPSTPIGTLLASPVDPSVVWSVSGSYSWQQPAVSTDGMETWTAVTLPPDLASLGPSTPGYSTLVIDPSSPERAFLMALVYQSTDGSLPAIDRFFATEDAGASWRESTVPTAPTVKLPTFTAVVDGGSSIFFELEGTIFVSKDWAKTWESVGPAPTQDASASAATLVDPRASDPGHLFVATAIDSTGTTQFWGSTDSGATWTNLAAPASVQSLRALAPDASVLVGWAANGTFTTHDSGANWQPGPIVPMVNTLVSSQAAPFPIWAPADGLRSLDGGLTWQPLALPSLGQIVPSGADGRIALWIAQDGSELRRTEDAGATWTKIPIDPNLNEIHGATSCPPPGKCLYVVYSNTSSPYAMTLKRSDDGGRTWSAGVPIASQTFYLPDSLKVDPDDDRHLVGSGGQGMVDSKDGGATWTTQSMDASRIALLGGGVILVSNSGRGVQHQAFRSTDDGVTWTQIYPNQGTFFQSPQRPGEVYFLGDNLYRSKDKGATWTPIAPDQLPINALADAPGGKIVVAVSDGGLVSFE